LAAFAMKRNTVLFIAASICTSLYSSGLQAQKRPVVKATSFKKDTLNIKSFGAVADGLTLNTQSINNAITACNKKGGGVVKVPKGFWLTGPIVLQSNVNLYLESDALLQFTNDFDQYPLVEGSYEGERAYRNQSPISANGAVNIAITGNGIVDGWGDAWRPVKKGKLTESQWTNKVASGGLLTEDKKTWYPSKKALLGTTINRAGVVAAESSKAEVEAYKDYLRPNMLVLTKCSRILLEGVTFQNSPAWNLHPLMSDNITIRNVTVKNPWYAQNGDGLDLESCSNVLVENSVFDVGDDGICIKSGRDEEGRKRAMPTQNVIVRNCVVYHAHGGFVIGSEMSGGAKNIFVEDCTFIGTDIGLRFKTTRGRGGVVENIFINNIQMKDIPGDAILFDMYYAAKDPVPMAGEKRELPKVEMLPVTEATPQFENFTISNVVCNGAAKAIFIRGLPEMHVKNIVLKNMVLQADKGIDCQEASNIVFDNIKLRTKEKTPLLYVLNSDKIVFNKIDYTSADLLLQVHGERSKKIVVSDTKTAQAVKKSDIDFGADKESIKVD
jgi:polygalacturonase